MMTACAAAYWATWYYINYSQPINGDRGIGNESSM